jgi:hypothetical protein
MILVADVDLMLLHELHSFGSVRNLRDRRKDVYSLSYLKKNEAATSPHKFHKDDKDV